MRALLLAILIAPVLSLVGCGPKGLDRTFDTSGPAALQGSLESMISGASPEEAAIMGQYGIPLLFAIQMQSFGGGVDYSKLTGRQVLERVIGKSMKDSEATFAKLEAQEKMAQELTKFKIDNVTYVVSNLSGKFMEPYGSALLTFALSNGSSIPIRAATFRTQLFIDGQNEPAADSEALMLFHDGLDAGKQGAVRYAPGGPFGTDGGWDKLSVKKANNPRLAITLVKIEDYDNRGVAAPDPATMTKAKANLEELRRQYAVIARPKTY